MLTGQQVDAFNRDGYLLPFPATFAAWHQDGTYFGLEPHALVTAWVALSAASHEAGCMDVVSFRGAPRELRHAALRPEHSLNRAGQAIVEPVDESGGAAMQLEAHVRPTGSVRMSALLVRGEARYGHVDLSRRPRASWTRRRWRCTRRSAAGTRHLQRAAPPPRGAFSDLPRSPPERRV